MRFDFICGLLALLGSQAFVLDAGAAPAPGEARPSIFLISVDTQRRDRLPVYGYARDTAPNTERLARSSLVFDNAIAAASFTAPSHASMLTGLYPQAHGIISNGQRLRPGVKTLAGLLADQGYQTAAVVSGYTLLDRTTSLSRGFDHYDDAMGQPGERYAHQVLPLVQRVLDQRDQSQPLFYFIHLFDPHYPYVAPANVSQRWEPEGAANIPSRRWPDVESRRKHGFTPDERQTYEARYDAEVRYADQYVGSVLQTLERNGLFEHSLIILTSDHGETLAERPFEFDHGGRLYDEQIRVPLIIRLPHGARGGRRVTADAHHVDFMPTVLDLLGLRVPASVAGVSLLKDLDAAPTARRPLFSLTPSRPRRVKHLGTPIKNKTPVACLRQPPFKLIAYPGKAGLVYELFDLELDPGERFDVGEVYPEIREAYAAELAAWYGDEEVFARPPQILPPETKEILRSLGYVE